MALKSHLQQEKMKIEFYRHNIEAGDIERVKQVLESVFLTTGSVCAEFEQAFSKYIQLSHTLTLSSCTGALHLSFLALGLKPGDEVITTPMTFIATVTAIMHAGLKPVFVDVEPETGLIDPKQIESKITSKTKAIVPVHLYGTMADMKAISNIAKKKNLFVVEDSAHCIEAERDGIKPGALGDTACFSFYATKNLTCGEGGAVATKHEHLSERIKVLRLHGMNKDAAARYSGLYKHWDVEEIGWKYNLDDIHAALLIKQLDRLNGYWKRREEIAKRYESAFQNVRGVRFPKIAGKGARHLQTLWVDAARRDQILHKLQERGIGVAVNYRAVHTLEFFKKLGFKPNDFPNAHKIGSETISIPLYSKLSDQEVDYIIEQVKTAAG